MAAVSRSTRKKRLEVFVDCVECVDKPDQLLAVYETYDTPVLIEFTKRTKMASGFNQPYPVPPVSYNPMQQQQQQQQQQVAMGMSQPQQNIQVSPSAGSIGQNPGLQQQQQSMLPTKEPNYAVLCRAGQEYVHDIVNKTNELFQLLKVTQLPNGLTQQATMPTFKERKAKAADLLEAITVLFRKLRVLYDHIVEYTSTLEKPPINSLLPFEGTEVDERGKNTEIYRFVSDEHKEVQEQVRQKNQQIKEVMCQMRNLIWEINTMISMRKL